MRPNEQIVMRFNDAISGQRLEDLAQLMAPEHRFVDTEDHTVEGKIACLDAWTGFFSAFPDYRNEFDEIHSRDDTVYVRGRSHCSNAALDGPALWSAHVAGGMVTEWRVYEDTVPNRHLLGFAERD